jgi:hypothetical protein
MAGRTMKVNLYTTNDALGANQSQVFQANQ